MRFILSLCLIFLNIGILISQNTVTVSYRYNNTSEEYYFEAKNDTYSVYTVVVYFNSLDNLTASTSLPAIKVVRPGVNRLFSLKRNGPGRTYFDWGYVRFVGTHNAKPEDVKYVLPTKPGKQVDIRPLSSLKKLLGQADDGKYYGVGFNMLDGDTICATRKGIVEAIEEEIQTDTLTFTFTRNRNALRIRHEDGTVGYYRNFKNGSTMVEEGQEVLPGSSLAIATQTSTRGDALVMFSVNYIHLEPQRNDDYSEWSSFEYVEPIFFTKDYQGLLETRKTYISILNEDLVTQEMSRREKKKYLKN